MRRPAGGISTWFYNKINAGQWYNRDRCNRQVFSMEGGASIMQDDCARLRRGRLRIIAALLISAAAGLAHAEDIAWVAKRVTDPFTNSSRCVAESTHQSMNDGYQDGNVYLQVDRERLVFVTQSNVDLGSTEQGLQVDGDPAIAFEQVMHEQQAVVEQHIEEVIASFQEGRKVKVRLKYWPTWPSKGSKEVEFSLIGFQKAFAQLPGC